MAMTFTIASAAREALAQLILDRRKREKEEDDRKTAEYEEVGRHLRPTRVTFDPWISRGDVH